MNDKDKILWIERLRNIACCAVVFLHVSAMEFHLIPVDSMEWQAINFWNSITRFAVPVFFMISGLLYLNPSKEMSLSKLYKKNILKLFITYWFWMLFYGFWNMIVYGEGVRGSVGQIIKEIIKTALLVQPAHMWYLPALIGIMMICPILRLVTEKEDPQLLKYLIVICFVFGVFRKTIFLFDIPHGELVTPILNSISPEMTAGWVGLYLFGYYLYRYGVSRRVEYGLYLAGGLSAVTAIILNARKALQTETATNDFCNNLTMFSVLLALAVFVFFMKHGQEKCSEKITRNISCCTLGIYLLHPFWIDVFQMAGITGTTYNPWFMIPLLGLVIFLASWVCVQIFKRIPVLGKWLI